MRLILTFSLQSGSNGNAIYVEADGVRLLFDAGISGRRATQRMLTHDRRMHDVDALIISHDHADHIQYAGVFQRLFGPPIYMTQATHNACRHDLGRLVDVRYFESGDRLVFGGVTVHTIRTPHDAADGVAFVVECAEKRLGILTDLGCVFDGLDEIVGSLDAAYMESNYDPQMLARGSYPPELKQRIRGSGGHISNEESADVIERCIAERLQWVALAHLSDINNTPELALETHRQRYGDRIRVRLAPRYEASALLEV
ncbi:MAG: MBL fold metallo-hydrolase [Planctomycetes bacterium]|nr:MBL fold metallo-hydrolase [Planctomycetota bacterium]